MKKYMSIIIRYLIILLIALPNLFIFYTVFTPLTIYPLYFILQLFFDVSLSNATLLLNGFQIQIINACIAGSAYYLLFALNLSVPGIILKQRAKMLCFSFLFLLVLNIIRILTLILVLFYGASFFDITHKFFWYLISTLLVVLIWFAEVKVFKLKQIPVYSDLTYLYSASKLKNKKKSKSS